MKSSLWWKIFLIGGSLIVSLVVAEGLLQFRQFQNQPIETRNCRRFSSRYHHELIPNATCRSRYPEWDTTFSVNSLGMRGPEVTVAKPADTYRIVLVGDSFIESESVNWEDTAGGILQQQLTGETGRSIEVINAGVISYSPIIYARIIADKVIPLTPDLVMVNVDMSDFQNDYSYRRDMDEGGSFRNILFQQQMGQPHVAAPFIGTKVKYFLRTHSLFYSMSADLVKSQIRQWRHIPEPTIFQVNDPISDPHFATRSVENAQRPEMWMQFLDSMEKIKATLGWKQIPWVIVIYPYGHQAAPDEWMIGRTRNGFAVGQIYPSVAADRLVEEGERMGIKVVNLVPYFQTAAVRLEAPLYYPVDGHFTPAGQRVFAKGLAEVINDYYPHDSP